MRSLCARLVTVRSMAGSTRGGGMLVTSTVFPAGLSTGFAYPYSVRSAMRKKSPSLNVNSTAECSMAAPSRWYRR